MPSNDPVQRFTDIVDNIDHVERFTTGLNAETFAANDQVIFAVKYAPPIISEATAKLGDIAPGPRLDIPWREIRGLSKSADWAIGCGMSTTRSIRPASG